MAKTISIYKDREGTYTARFDNSTSPSPWVSKSANYVREWKTLQGARKYLAERFPEYKALFRTRR